MKRLILSILLLVFSLSCTQKWEYKVVTYVSKKSRTGEEAFQEDSIIPSDESLSEDGSEGWEIATSYVEIETAFPNFGEQKYHTGIKSNVRSKRLVIIYKRPK